MSHQRQELLERLFERLQTKPQSSCFRKHRWRKGVKGMVYWFFMDYHAKDYVLQEYTNRNDFFHGPGNVSVDLELRELAKLRKARSAAALETILYKLYLVRRDWWIKEQVKHQRLSLVTVRVK